MSDITDFSKNSLRPQNLEQIIGRHNEKNTLKVMIEAAKLSQQSVDHLLFYGPPGIGKTSMALVMAAEMGVDMKVTSGPAIAKQGDLAAILSSLSDQSILFIDEIHRLKRAIEEILYPAMEDGFLDIVIGEGAGARSIRVDLPAFTLIGATTRMSSISEPLRDRFGAHFHLDYYTEQELEEIVEQKVMMLGLDILPDAAELIATRARRTARVAVMLVKRAHELCLINDQTQIDTPVAERALEMLGIDETGLDKASRKYLQILIDKFAGQATGLTTLSAAMGSEDKLIEEVIEPYLIREGYIKKTPRGRIPTDKAINIF